MLKLTSLEQESFDVICTVMNAFALDKQVGRKRFSEVMGEVRTLKVHLENKMFGCYSGLHASDCFCTPETPGLSAYAVRRQKNKFKKKPASFDRYE